MKLVDCLASWIPSTDEGNKWRDFNEKLADDAHGLLPAVQKSFLSIATARGSHTTAIVRIVKLGAKGVHEQLCHEGYVSRSKICEQRPSFNEPLQKGLPYTIIKSELVAKCPKLMSVLSRTGNVSHGVHRIATALQSCMSVFRAVQEVGTEDSNQVKKLACRDSSLSSRRMLNITLLLWQHMQVVRVASISKPLSSTSGA